MLKLFPGLCVTLPATDDNDYAIDGVIIDIENVSGVEAVSIYWKNGSTIRQGLRVYYNTPEKDMLLLKRLVPTRNAIDTKNIKVVELQKIIENFVYTLNLAKEDQSVDHDIFRLAVELLRRKYEIK